MLSENAQASLHSYEGWPVSGKVEIFDTVHCPIIIGDGIMWYSILS